MNFFTQLLETKKGRIILIALSVLLLVGLGFLFWNISNPSTSFEETFSENTDPSGLTIVNSSAEPENTNNNTPLVIGYQIFYNIGLSKKQQDKIYNETISYFTKNYPSIKKISYIKDSLTYPNATRPELATDIEKTFFVTLNTMNSINDLLVNINEL